METLETLQKELERAETQLFCADMIDSGTRRDREMTYWKGRVAELKRKIVTTQEVIMARVRSDFDKQRLSKIAAATAGMPHGEAMMLLADAIAGIFMACNPSASNEVIETMTARIARRVIFMAVLNCPRTAGAA
ncbi:hypothetical protein [Phyllobacterium leguminum]|uniref:Uncharacterized protein n=1 Tax=Phyllobacterium leguminum TaxID=314237 RepID=A0A318SZH4_9HYPH|nr:hypothetical protein [Phyllobacterium leguminum]PYE87526.1 hypothetical protein C7477_11227 [Phyllobacterium leguminum]